MRLFHRQSATGAEADAVEPDLPPEILDQYRRLSSSERKRLLAAAAASANASLEVDPTRNWQAERDASIYLELSGTFKRMSDAVRRELERPGGW
jgi:hypothetical protein